MTDIAIYCLVGVSGGLICAPAERQLLSQLSSDKDSHGLTQATWVSRAWCAVQGLGLHFVTWTLLEDCRLLRDQLRTVRGFLGAQRHAHDTLSYKAVLVFPFPGLYLVLSAKIKYPVEEL